MKLAEWTAKVTEELTAAGFQVRQWQGFPMASTPITHADKVKFLKHRLTIPVERRVYSEGCLFMPVRGSGVTL